MLSNVTHAGGVEDAAEILFSTPFDYMFADAARSPDHLLPVSERTVDALLMLGDAMGDASSPPDPAFDSTIPAVFTYLGQFIDHDVTARTDRENGVSRISQPDGRPAPVVPVDPDRVVATLRNGRRPNLDLDSVYGDGPGLIPAVETEASGLYDGATGRLILQDLAPGKVDLLRDGRTACIADGRNDENVNISQLHAAFIAFHNRVVDQLASPPPGSRRYAKAREIVRWAYQVIVVRDYLRAVCDRTVLADVVRNGPYFYGHGAGEIFMPLEFSVAAFRFGHSMIRPSYRIGTGGPVTIRSILGVSTENHAVGDLLEEVGGTWRLRPENLVHWSNFVAFPGEPAPQMARKIDPMLSQGLFDLPFEAATGAAAMMRHLAQRNLVRGYLLSIPTGQAVAAAMGVVPLVEDDLIAGESQALADAIAHGRFQRRTPLWFYILKEAQAQTGGMTLGAVGSRIVSETLVGLLKRDPASYLNNRHHGRISAQGVKVPGRRQPIGSLADMLDYTGLQK